SHRETYSHRKGSFAGHTHCIAVWAGRLNNNHRHIATQFRFQLTTGGRINNQLLYPYSSAVPG
ncbi:MAG: hypothetical protein ABI675_24740, partial [Chitinophagaceae bacterium]